MGDVVSFREGTHLFYTYCQFFLPNIAVAVLSSSLFHLSEH